MSYGKEIGQVLAEEVLDLILEDELELMEIRDLDTLGAHITRTEQKYGKSHAKTKALKRLYKRKSGIEGIRNFGKPAEMSEDELQEIRGLTKLNMALNKTLLSQDPEDRRHAMRLQALKRRKMMLGVDEAEAGLCALCGQRMTPGVPCNCNTPTPVKSKVRGVADQPKKK